MKNRRTSYLGKRVDEFGKKNRSENQTVEKAKKGCVGGGSSFIRKSARPYWEQTGKRWNNKKSLGPRLGRRGS